MLILVGNVKGTDNAEDLGVNGKITVGIALGYGLDDRGSRVRFPTGAGNFSLLHHGSGAHSASYPVCTRVSFPRDEAVGA
jgi:hypothetical protein